jgi:hypothetical protein
MKTKVLCTLANKDDVRLAPVNDSGNTIQIRGLDIVGSTDPLPFKQNELYTIEIKVAP